MALICTNGVRECDGGCGCCEHEPKQIGNCEHCSDPVTDCEVYYDFDGILIHEECFAEWAHQHKKGY